MKNKLLTRIYDGFYEHRLLENASSLSFYTLLSIVPILAVLIGIGKGFGIDALIEQEVLEAVPNQQELAKQGIEFAQKALQESRGGIIAGMGVLLLLWSFVGLIGNFEKALNDIWGVKEGRSYSRRMGDFLGFIFLFPFILVAFSTSILFITSSTVVFFSLKGFLTNSAPT